VIDLIYVGYHKHSSVWFLLTGFYRVNEADSCLLERSNVHFALHDDEEVEDTVRNCTITCGKLNVKFGKTKV
jgi:hypothetical protein